MTAREMLGYGFIALPFVLQGVFIVATMGWLGLLQVIGLMAALLGPLAVAFWLLGGRV